MGHVILILVNLFLGIADDSKVAIVDAVTKMTYRPPAIIAPAIEPTFSDLPLADGLTE